MNEEKDAPEDEEKDLPELRRETVMTQFGPVTTVMVSEGKKMSQSELAEFIARAEKQTKEAEEMEKLSALTEEEVRLLSQLHKVEQ